jgi:RNA recognition motif-containing protein
VRRCRIFNVHPDSAHPQARTEDDPRIQPTDASPRQDAGKASIFFARVQPTVTPEQLLEVFSGFGHVVDLNLFR